MTASQPIGASSPSNRVGFRPLVVGAYALSLAAVVAMFVRGADFYFTPIGERAHHAGYWQLKSGGTIGHQLGILGSAMMVLMLLYSVRKRVRWLRRAGALSRWLDLHIYLGVFGPLLVVLHSSFKVSGLVAFSFWSMVIVACSGVLGRYLYQQIPRTRAGDELALAEVERLDRAISTQLRNRFGLDSRQLERLDVILGSAVEGGRAARILPDPKRRAALRQFTRECPSVPRSMLREFERVVRQKATIRRRILLWDRLHELFHYWQVLHKPFAIVMYLFMFIHVGVAIMTGYGRLL